MANARKYKLLKTESAPSGITTVNRTVTLSVLDSFSGENDGTPFSYASITEQQLGALTESTFNQRLTDFLIFAGVSDIALFKQRALVDEPSCEPTTQPPTSAPTTEPLVFPSIELTFNSASADSTISFFVNGLNRLFTAKTSPNTDIQEFQASTSGETVAISFVETFNDLLTDVGIVLKYSVTRNNNIVNIEATTANDTQFNFGDVTFTGSIDVVLTEQTSV